jgi:hypothetical protein
MSDHEGHTFSAELGGNPARSVHGLKRGLLEPVVPLLCKGEDFHRGQ